MIGKLTIQTDDDFAVFCQGRIRRYNETKFDSKNLTNIILIPKHVGSTKHLECLQDLEMIAANPNQYFDSTGGNRGIKWNPALPKNSPRYKSSNKTSLINKLIDRLPLKIKVSWSYKSHSISNNKSGKHYLWFTLEKLFVITNQL